MERGFGLSRWRAIWLAAPDAQHRRNSLLLGGFLLAVANAFIARVAQRQLGAGSVYYAILSIAIMGALLTVWSLLRRREFPVWLGATLEVLMLAPVYWIVPNYQRQLMEAGLLTTPFAGLKLVTVVLAVVVPGNYMLQLALFGSFVAEAVVVWFVLGMGDLPALTGAGEPGMSLVFVFVVGVLLVFRWRFDLLARDLHQTQARARVLTAVAHMFLKVREQSNTPLQNLRLVQQLLVSGKADTADLQESMARSLTRLEDMNKSLDRYDHLVDWSGDPLELDAEAEKLLQAEDRAAKVLKSG